MRLAPAIRRRWWVGALAAIAVGLALVIRTLTAPLQVHASVTEGDREVPRTAAIQLRFTHDMEAASVEQSVKIEPAVPLTVTARGKQAFEVRPQMQADTHYRLFLEGARAASGRNAVSYSVSFRTEPAPQVAQVTLDGHGLNQSQLGVPTSGKLKLTFTQAMDSGRTPVLLEGKELSSRELQWAQDFKSVSTELKLGRSRTYVLTVPQTALNRRQDPFLADYKLAFTTVIDVPTAGSSQRIGAGAPAIIQIENSSDARPQWGMQQADMVYEYISEGSVPRLTALYWHPMPDLVGPVRSCRLITLQIQQMYKGMIYCSGANDYILGQVWKVPNLVNDYSRGQGGVFFRTDARYAPHDVLIRGGNATAFTAAQNMGAPDYQLMPKHEDGAHAGAPAPQIQVPDHDSAWTYDPASKQYLKRQDGRPLMNVGTGQLKAKTVVVQQVTSYLDTHPGNSFHGYFTEYYELKGEGTADVYTGGVMIHATWRRTNPGAPLVYYSESGDPIEFDTGLTWVHVLGNQNLRVN